jgi:hypothetical protein
MHNDIIQTTVEQSQQPPPQQSPHTARRMHLANSTIDHHYWLKFVALPLQQTKSVTRSEAMTVSQNPTLESLIQNQSVQCSFHWMGLVMETWC